MHDDDQDTLANLNAAPVNPLPPLVWLLILAVLGVEAALSLAGWGLIGGAQGVGWRIAAIQDYAFSSAIQQTMLENRHYVPRLLMRYLTYSFVAGNPMAALFVAVLIAALGKTVAERMAPAAFVVLVLGVPAVAALIFGLLTAADPLGWLIGGMPMVFALVGAFTWLKWRDAAGDVQKQRRAFSMIGLLLAARLGFGLMAEAGPGWIAELVAFALGFGLSALVLGPGSWARTRARIRG